MNIRKAFSYLREYANNSVCNNYDYPKILSYLITNQCNSHCITCNVWKALGEIHIEGNNLHSFLNNELMSNIRHVGISGGEPSMSNNLIEHIHIIVKTLPKIETLSITSNCIISNFWIQNLCQIRDFCKSAGIYFQFNISLDGIGSIHDRIRGTKGNYANTLKVINFSKNNGINYQIHTTINKYNVYHVNHILRFAKKTESDILFRLASKIYRLDNDCKLDMVELDNKELSFLCDFLLSKDLCEHTKSPGRKLFYKTLVKQLLGDGKRIAPCYFKNQGLVLASDGTLSYCSRFSSFFSSIDDDDIQTKFKNRQLFDTCCSGACETCYHDQTGFWPLKQVIYQYLEKEITSIKKLICIFKYLFNPIKIRRKTKSNSDVQTVCMIGMYGGEHVGDAAILGGTILRTKQRYDNLKEVVVYSFRKDRTQCWVNNLIELSKTMKISVSDSIKDFSDCIKRCDLLVWAGGPIMELPLVLSRNYYFVNQARSFGIPFEIIGIGYGPINSLFCKQIAKLILKSADIISVRSTIDSDYLKEYKLLDLSIPPKDPAFTYLDSLPSDIILEDKECKSIQSLLKNHRKNILAINLRPLWNRYGTKSSFCYSDFINEIASLINNMQNTTVVFFSMNADKFGFSDLDIAYDIQELVNENADYRIWEYEPSINGIITLLRHMDCALCMRFHAVIFAQSQNIPVIGIDYSLNGKGKVSTLFNNEDNVIQMKDFKMNIAIAKIRQISISDL